MDDRANRLGLEPLLGVTELAEYLGVPAQRIHDWRLMRDAAPSDRIAIRTLKHHDWQRWFSSEGCIKPMAQKYIVQLVDDLTNEPIEDGAGETVTFAIDGVSYAIDLSAEHADQFRGALKTYISAARKADLASASKTRSSSRSAAAPKSDLRDVRSWAQSNGFTVSSRGRIPATVQEAYAAAH